MAICKHCGAELEEGLDYCPNCNQNITDETYDIFDDSTDNSADSYNIFDDPGVFDMDKFLANELQETGSSKEEPIISQEQSNEELKEEPESDILFDFGDSDADTEQETMPDSSEFILPEMEPESESINDFSELDDLLDGMETSENSATDTDFQEELLNPELKELLAAAEVSETEAREERKRKKAAKEAKAAQKEKKSLLQRLFGNVPVDPSKIKEEPTPEELEERKAKKAEEKKAAAEEKKKTAEEKKKAAKEEKEEKARQKVLEKEEKKAQKLEKAKQVLEEMQPTRINRVGAMIVFIFFALITFGLVLGSDFFGYSISMKNAEKSFNLALNNDTRHYNDAYERIYGLDVKAEDQELNDKIMVVMYVNKELNSYNNLMAMDDYNGALHALLKGIYRYGKYYDQAALLGADKDLDFVRTQILKELDKTFGISEDEAEVLRGMLEDAMLNKKAQNEYNKKIYEIVQENGLLEE